MGSAFRHDINGLRAVAVVLVVLFHFRVPGFEAGFLGVDIFFVISGYLMAALLMRGLDGGEDTRRLLWSFYFARARRIVPALAVLVGVLLLVGWWTLSPADYEQLAKHARYALAFASNHQFYSEAGYFDVASHEKWLLHTWSLAVEWQFYLILPLLFLTVWRLRSSRTALTVLVAVATVLSFGVAVRTAGENPEAGFYLLPSRAWELLLGSLVYLLADRIAVPEPTRRWLEAIGLGLIVLALVVVDETSGWSGAAALMPVVGSALVILASRHSTGWAIPHPVQWLGRISYSLYLWHWPVFVGLVFLGVQGQWEAISVGIAIALLLATLSFSLVEQPSRHGMTRAGHVKALTMLVFGVLVVGGAAFAIEKKGGVPDRMPERFDRIMAEVSNVNPHRKNCHGRPGWDNFPWCTLGGDNIRAVVIGDSHAASLATAVQTAVTDDPDEGIIMATYTGCPTVFGVDTNLRRLECAEFNRFVEGRLEDVSPEVPLIVANRLGAYVFGSHQRHDVNFGRPLIYFQGGPVDTPNETFLDEFRVHLVETACRLSRDRPVYWVGPVPEMPVDVPRWLARQTLLRGEGATVLLPRDEYDRRHEFVADVLRQAARECPNLTVLDPVPWLCDENACAGSRDGMPLYYDEHHLSERGNRYLVPMFADALSQPSEASGWKENLPAIKGPSGEWK